jgi:D-threo-aldose 1-dehydrogenase
VSGRLARRGVVLTPLALGCAPLAGLYEPVSEEQARATVDAAWEAGIRTFDTAPQYGAGRSEERVGAALRERPRERFALCTKVGRRLVPRGEGEPPPGVFSQPPPFDLVTDFSADGVRRALEESLTRLGLDRVDLLHVHDPDDHMDEAIGEALPALLALRDEGVVRAVGAGMNHAAPLARIVRESDVDCVLLAGRLTLLDGSALDELLPLCTERDVDVIAAGVFNSGLLADPDAPGATYDYLPAPAALRERARAIAALCARHGATLPAAAMRFPLAHPAVAAVLVGVRSAGEVRADAEAFAHELPAALWAELADAGLLPGELPPPVRGGP